jgi:hypothetical protein
MMVRYERIHFDDDKELQDAIAKHRGFVAFGRKHNT